MHTLIRQMDVFSQIISLSMIFNTAGRLDSYAIIKTRLERTDIKRDPPRTDSSTDRTCIRPGHFQRRIYRMLYTEECDLADAKDIV